MVVTSGKEGGRKMKRVKVIKQTNGRRLDCGWWTVVVVLESGTPETYMMLLANVIPINLSF